MNFSTWSIRNPIPPIAFFAFMCVLGIFGFRNLAITQFPDVDVPVVTISVGQIGAGPTEIANGIVLPIETALTTVAGIDHVTSTATDGLANITVQFLFSVDPLTALNNVKDAVTSVQANLPQGITAPRVTQLTFTGRPVLTYAVTDPSQSVEDLSHFIDTTVSHTLSVAGAVGNVSRIGGASATINVDLKPDRLLAFGITISDVNAQLLAANINLGAGSGSIGGQQLAIQSLGSAASVNDLAATPIQLPGGQVIRLSDIASVTEGTPDLTTFAMFNGQPVVAFGVYRATGASDLVAANNAQAALAGLKESHPSTTFALIDNTTDFTTGNYKSAMETLYEGAALAVIVVFLFLRDWRATLITAIALPLSIVPTFFVMDALGFSLNTVSLLGITLVTGILVDDAIVEIENVARHLSMGRPAYEAAKEAAIEISTTVIAISSTIIAVFTPVSFLSGIAGQYFKQFGLTVAVAVFFSLLVARLITPMLAAYFLHDRPNPNHEREGTVMRRYQAALTWTLQHRLVTLLAGALIFGLSIYSATLLPTEFVPKSDTGRSVVMAQLPPGTTLDEARATAREISSVIRQIPEVQTVFVNATSLTAATIGVNYGPKDSRARTSYAIINQMRTLLAGVPDVQAYVASGQGQRDLTVNVVGDTVADAAAAARTLVEQMHSLPSVVAPASNAALVRPELDITPKPTLAAAFNVSASSLAQAIEIATSGANGNNAPQYALGDRLVPVLVRLDVGQRNDLSTLGNLRLPVGNGATSVPLAVVADLTISSGPEQVVRYDGRYLTEVDADLADNAVEGATLDAINNLPIARAMPAGTAILPGGDTEVTNDIFSGFALAMVTGVMLVYVVLVLLFNSFLTPFSVLLSLPLAIGGAIFALYLNGSAIGMPVVIGFLMLMGIVAKNAIMLVEFAVEGVARGVERAEAIRDAARKRARPIVMTTIAMTAGMLPSALALGDGGEFRAPMAIAVIGGLILSTVLSLVFVPSVFSAILGMRDKLAPLAIRFLGINKPNENGNSQV
ncbi:MAG: efflux RND transporter permease subunit [Rhodobacteraceae bacterium]|nr:efflux RND transporter permease subunit [Paracoccaceae bacterium]